VATVAEIPKNAQVGMEYLMIVGFVTFILTIALVTSQFYSDYFKEQITVNQVDRIGKELIDTAEEVYFFGEPTRLTIRAYMPDDVSEIIISDKLIAFTIQGGGNLFNITHYSQVSLQGNISSGQGLKDIKVAAAGGFVWINGT